MMIWQDLELLICQIFTNFHNKIILKKFIITHPWCNGDFTNISHCEV